MMRPVEVRRREFEVLNKLNHENIVKLYASETEVSLELISHNISIVDAFHYLKALKHLWKILQREQQLFLSTCCFIQFDIMRCAPSICNVWFGRVELYTEIRDFLSNSNFANDFNLNI